MKKFIQSTFKPLILGLILFCSASQAWADHILGSQMSFEWIGNNQYRIILEVALEGTTCLDASNFDLNQNGQRAQLVDYTGNNYAPLGIFRCFYVSKLINGVWTFDQRLEQRFESCNLVYDINRCTILARVVTTSAIVTISGNEDIQVFTYFHYKSNSLGNISSPTNLASVPHCLIRTPLIPQIMRHTEEPFFVVSELYHLNQTFTQRVSSFVNGVDITNLNTYNQIAPYDDSQTNTPALNRDFPFIFPDIPQTTPLTIRTYEAGQSTTFLNSFNSSNFGPGLTNNGTNIATGSALTLGKFNGATLISSNNGSIVYKDFVFIVFGLGTFRISDFLDAQETPLVNTYTSLHHPLGTTRQYYILTDFCGGTSSFSVSPLTPLPSGMTISAPMPSPLNSRKQRVVVEVMSNVPSGVYNFTLDRNCSGCGRSKDFTIIVCAGSTELSNYLNINDASPIPGVTDHISICRSQGANLLVQALPSGSYSTQLQVAGTLPNNLINSTISPGNLLINIPPNSSSINENATYSFSISGNSGSGTCNVPFIRTYSISVLPEVQVSLSNYLYPSDATFIPGVTDHITICKSQGANLLVQALPSGSYSTPLQVSGSLPNNLTSTTLSPGNLFISIPPNSPSINVNSTYNLTISGNNSSGLCVLPFNRTYRITVLP